MADEFKPLTTKVENSLNLSYQVEKLYGALFPSVIQQGLFKLEGVQDLGIAKAEKLLGLGYKLEQNENKELKLDFTGVKVAKIDEGNIMSYLGTPIFMPVWFKGGKYPVIVNGEQQLRDFKTLRLPATTTVSFSRNKDIAKTAPSGGTGTVKELFAFSDWDITIQGIIITEGNREGQNASIFPEEELNELKKYEEVADSIEVFGGLFEAFNINRVAVERAVLGNTQGGKPNVIPFQFRCTSDEPVELIINAK